LLAAAAAAVVIVVVVVVVFVHGCSSCGLVVEIVLVIVGQ